MSIEVWKEQAAKIAYLTAERDALAQENKRLVEALEKAADVFDFYAKHHATKTIPDEEKARQNYGHRNMCRAALAAVKEKP